VNRVTNSPRPVPLAISVDAIRRCMSLLLDYRHWVGWKYVWRDGKWTKIPINPSTGRYASVSEPASWAGFDEALAAMGRYALDGIGFVLATDDPFAIVDLDHVLDGGGRIADWAADILGAFDPSPTLIEKSAGGDGLHVWMKGTLPDGGRGRRTGGIELYCQARLVAVTGVRFDGGPLGIEDCQAQLTSLHQRLFPLGVARREPFDSPLPTLTDEELIDRATAARNGSKFHRLFSVGDCSEYFSQSEADQALVNLIRFWTDDPDQIERIWRRSALWRDKAEDRPDYVERTIGEALRTGGRWQPGVFAAPNENGGPAQRDQWVSLEEHLRVCGENRELKSILSAHAEVIERPDLSHAEKVEFIALSHWGSSAYAQGKADDRGFLKLVQPTFGKAVGVLPNPKTGRISGSIGSHLRNMAERGLFENEMRQEWEDILDRETGEFQRRLVRSTWIRLPHEGDIVGNLRMVRRLEAAARPRRNDRRTEPLTCPRHPWAKLDLTCSVCGDVVGDGSLHKTCASPDEMPTVDLRSYETQITWKPATSAFDTQSAPWFEPEGDEVLTWAGGP
jgi:hypothetical protein